MKTEGYIISLFLAGIILAGCHNNDVRPVQFYHCRSNADIGPAEKEIFEALGSEKLNLRLFDVDKEEGQTQPKTIVRSFDASVLDAEYIPTVFMTNRVFVGITTVRIHQLAGDVLGMINSLSEENGLGNFNEIQIDCDWTTGTKDTFFTFLDHMKELSGKQISCTLRLHQVKYREQTGVPPADKVYLMAYATSDPTEVSGWNSILDMGLLRDYLSTLNDYPLDFDIALPLYSWAVMTNHLGKKKLINGVTEGELMHPDYKPVGRGGVYEVQEDVFLHGIWLNKDFLVKVESISPELLLGAKSFLGKKINRPYGLVYYHLDSLFVNRFPIDVLR
ncbi:hypothetical protein [Sinomicrobium sp. M5D2P9]